MHTNTNCENLLASPCLTNFHFLLVTYQPAIKKKKLVNKIV